MNIFSFLLEKNNFLILLLSFAFKKFIRSKMKAKKGEVRTVIQPNLHLHFNIYEDINYLTTFTTIDLCLSLLFKVTF